MVKRLDELEDHYRKANAADMPYIYAAKYDGCANTLSQADTQTLQRHGYGQALQNNWARFQDGGRWLPYGYVNGRNPFDKNALAGILNMYHAAKHNSDKSKDSSKKYLRENNLHDVSKEHLDAGKEVFNEYRRTGVLPKDFNGITHPGVVSAVKEQIAHDVHENIGLDITRRGDIKTDEGWSKAKESVDQFDPQRYGRTAVEAKAKHAADPTFSHDMYRLVDELKRRPRYTSVKGLSADDEENIELLGRRIKGRK